MCEFIWYSNKNFWLQQTNAQRTSKTPREPQTVMEDWTFLKKRKLEKLNIFRQCPFEKIMWCFHNTILISFFCHILCLGWFIVGHISWRFPFIDIRERLSLHIPHITSLLLNREGSILQDLINHPPSMTSCACGEHLRKNTISSIVIWKTKPL